MLKSEGILLINHMLQLNQVTYREVTDLQKKLDLFQRYYNVTRAHSSLEMKTPKEMASDEKLDKKVASLDNYRWQSHCRGFYQLPIAA